MKSASFNYVVRNFQVLIVVLLLCRNKYYERLLNLIFQQEILEYVISDRI